MFGRPDPNEKFALFENTFEYPSSVYLFYYNEDRGDPDGGDVGPFG